MIAPWRDVAVGEIPDSRDNGRKERVAAAQKDLRRRNGAGKLSSGIFPGGRY